MDKKKRVEALELNDEELAGVSGGQYYAEADGKHYHYEGGGKGSGDWNKSYLCPKCGRPVHWGTWERYYCINCDESWYWEDKLVINTASGVWREISKDAYEAAMRRE